MGKKILIADDSKTFRALEEKLLQARGYTVLGADNGAQALQLALKERPDLILLDLQMPLMDGVQALAALKRHAETSAIPVIVVTTIGREKDREILLAGGASDFIAKPIDGSDLVRRIRKLIGE